MPSYPGMTKLFQIRLAGVAGQKSLHNFLNASEIKVSRELYRSFMTYFCVESQREMLEFPQNCQVGNQKENNVSSMVFQGEGRKCAVSFHRFL